MTTAPGIPHALRTDEPLRVDAQAVRGPAAAPSAPGASSIPVQSAEPAGPPSPPTHAQVRAAVRAAVDALLAKQRHDHVAQDGLHWCAELEGDSILSSEYLLMKFILGQADPAPDGAASPQWPRLARIANQLRLSQRADGSWGQYPGSPPDLSACVKAYFCLKLFGDSPDAPHMAQARQLIRSLGGAEAINTFSMFYLACLGQVSWNACPAIPPQIILLPRWFPFHLSKVAAWTRTMILPLAICSALRPVRTLPPECSIEELFLDPRARRRLNRPWDRRRPLSWHNFFLAIDRALKLCRALRLTPLRRRALRRAEQWILRRVDPSTTQGLGAIFPPMVYLQIAFKALGYSRDHPVIRRAEADLDAFLVDQPSDDPRLDHIRLQPCFSPVWDTAIALDALTEAGLTAAGDERIARACDWLRARQVRLVGDWHDNLRPEDQHLRPGHSCALWAFEYRNDWYPDVDDTGMVAKALARAGDRPGEHHNRQAADRAVRWILAMQNDDGGWAAFDRTRHRPWMEAIPFADHNAMQDPSCSDITGRVTEALIISGLPRDHPAILRALRYLLDTQQPEGCWWGRWGVNYLYGTWQAVNGIVAAVAPRPPTRPGWVRLADLPSEPAAALARARDWLLLVQNADGGFGESPNSYLDRSLMGQGPSTASQTAWGLLTLMHLLPIDHPAVTRAVTWLWATQLREDKAPFTRAANDRADYARTPPGIHSTPSMPSPAGDPVADIAGSWNEHWFTGTGFPKVFYLRYHLYRHSFPLKALARYAAIRAAAEPEPGA
jgi:squalene-hopene/tetraprenyl-beta-curcumene cyclase